MNAMDRLSPLFLLFVLYLFFGVIGRSSRKNKSGGQKPGQPARNHPAAPPARPVAGRQPSAEKPKQPAAAPRPEPETEISFTAHRGADGTLHPTERHQHATAAPSLLTMEGQGIEGFDPCHDYMLDDPVLPVCEDLDRSAPTGPAPASLPLSFTKDSVVNAVVMSEILNRRNRTRTR